MGAIKNQPYLWQWGCKKMVYDSLCVGLYLKTAFGQVDIANDFRQIISATLLWHIPKFHSRYICVTLRPIKLLYSFLESLHNV